MVKCEFFTIYQINNLPFLSIGAGFSPLSNYQMELALAKTYILSQILRITEIFEILKQSSVKIRAICGNKTFHPTFNFKLNKFVI
jgi:hypothetical protein